MLIFPSLNYDRNIRVILGQYGTQKGTKPGSISLLIWFWRTTGVDKDSGARHRSWN